MITKEFKKLLVAFDGNLRYRTIFGSNSEISDVNYGPNISYKVLNDSNAHFYYSQNSVPYPKFIIGSGGGQKHQRVIN